MRASRPASRWPPEPRWCSRSIGLLADRFEHYAASLLCITPTLLLTAGAFYSTRMQSLANDEAERLAQESVPRVRLTRA